MENRESMETAKNNQPDWGLIAEKFDLWLPQLAPVGEALLKALDAQMGDAVLDVASGTGEPALTLARRMGDTVRITGTDAAEPMVRVAQRKVEQENLPHIHFHCMAAESLTFNDNAFDKVMCRFGVMLFEDSLQGLRQIHRVLKPAGRFSIVVWSTPETMPTLCWAYQVFKNRVPSEKYPPLAKVTSLGLPGVLEDLLRQAGFTNFAIRAHTFHYRFPSFDAYWNVVEQSDILKMQYDALAEKERGAIRQEIAALASGFMKPEGLVIPHEFLLATGMK
ncbi:MAG: class I SAM-dependent methyltransferase [Pseudomonadota bacterium]